MATIEKRGANSYRLEVSLGYDANGNRIRERRTVKVPEDIAGSKRKLEAWLQDELSSFRKELETGQYIKPKQMTLNEVVDLWLQEFANNPDNLSPTTRKKYLEILEGRLLPRFGHRRYDEIEVIELVAYMNSLYKDGARLDGKPGLLSTGTIDNVHKTLTHIYDRLVEWNMIASNPMDKVKRPTVSHKPKNFYTEEEARFIIQALYKEPRKHRLMVLGALIGGCRRGELNAVKWKNVNFEDKSIAIEDNIPLTKKGSAVEKGPKSKSSKRVIIMPDWYMKELREYAMEWRGTRKLADDNQVWLGGDEEYIFHNGFGKPFYYQYATTWWKRFCNRHKLRYITFHELRHSSVTLIIEDVVKEGQSVEAILKAIQERIGHSRYQTTFDIYGHVTKVVSEITAQKFDKFDPKAQRNAGG